VEPRGDDALLPGAEELDARGGTRVRRGVPELLDLLVAETCGGDARERKHDVPVGKRKGRARLELHAQRRALRLVPKTLRRVRLEIDFIHTGFLVERRPCAVRV